MRTLNTQQDVNNLMNINNYSHTVTSVSWKEVNRRTHAEQEHQPTRSKIQSLFRQKSVYEQVNQLIDYRVSRPLGIDRIQTQMAMPVHITRTPPKPTSKQALQLARRPSFGERIFQR